MAHLACYWLRAYGKKADLERFRRIMQSNDDDYVIYAFDRSSPYNALNHCDNGRHYMDFFGEVKWSSDHLSETSDVGTDRRTGRKVITWLDASRIFNLTMEWYCEECGSMVCEYFSICNGINIRSDIVYWSWPSMFDYEDHQKNIDCFEGEVSDALDEGIPLDMSQVEEIRANDYEILEQLDRFSFGGYDWREHSEDEILNAVAPIVRTDIRRL